MAIKAIQQFQLGTALNSEAEARQTLARLKAAGYEGIELCAFMIHPTPWIVKILTKFAGMPVGGGGKLDWPALIRESGLLVPSLHQYLNAIEEDPAAVAAEAKTFGASYVTVTGMYRFNYASSAEVSSLAARLNAAGAALAKEGIGLLYHNHNIEFSPTDADGKCAYEILVSETDPACVNFEFDSFWAADAGVPALEWMRRLGERLKLYHITDRGARIKGTPMTPILKQDCVELGRGNMELAPMIEQALAAGAVAIILESHKNWIDGDPLKSAEISAKFLSKFV